MCGHSSLRWRFDGAPNDMQRWITGTDLYECGTDDTIDFLFGFAGHEYRKLTTPAEFKPAIIASIHAGKPVIAKVKSGSPRFYLISGYDGDKLICPDFTNKYWNFVKNGPEEIGPDGPPKYDEIEALYIFGEKTKRRYTLKDGLQNIRRTMEYNIREKVLDGYLAKLNGDEFLTLTPEQRKARAIRLHETVLYIYNIVSFIGAFASDKNPHTHYLHQEIHPALTEFWDGLNEQHWIILNAGHYINGFRNRDWLTLDPSEIPEICAGMCEVIENVKKADARLLDLINQAIEICKQQ
jgi:hypothetical protein